MGVGREVLLCCTEKGYGVVPEAGGGSWGGDIRGETHRLLTGLTDAPGMLRKGEGMALRVGVEELE